MEPIRAQYTDRYEVHKGERVLVMEIGQAFGHRASGGSA